MENWLRRPDYNHLIMEDHLDQILNDLTDQDYVLNEAELASEVELTSYLRGYYNTALVFATIMDWDANTQYSEADSVWYNDYVYTYKGAGTDGTSSMNIDNPEEDTLWLLLDPRNAKLKQCMIDICLYHIHSRISPRNIPHLRIMRYEQCIEWLNKVAKGDLTLDLPVNENPDGSKKQRKPRVNSVWARTNWYWSSPAPNIKTYE